MATQRIRTIPSPDEDFGELTPREYEVARLISQGLTNEAIAQELVLTRGTVANHVAHILAKTGARSRVQIAVKLVRTQPERRADDVLGLLRRFQTLGTTDPRNALQHATELLAAFFGADACDAFVCDQGGEMLVAVASSQTRLVDRQRSLGLQHLPLSHGGRVAWVHQQQQPFCDGHLEEDAFELVGIRYDLGVRSMLAVPFTVCGERRGVLVVRSVEPDRFTESDLELLRFVAYWLALVAQQDTLAASDAGHRPLAAVAQFAQRHNSIGERAEPTFPPLA